MQRLIAYLRAKPYRLWLVLGLLSLLLRLALAPFPGVVEAVYSRGLFVGIRWLLDHTLGLLPFPVVELLVVLLLAGIIFRTVRNWRKEKRTFKARLIRLGTNVAGIVGGLIFGFNILWGFNYQRQPVAHTLGLTLQAPDSVQIEQAFLRSTQAMIQARAAIRTATDSTLIAEDLPAHFEDTLHADLAKVLRADGYPVPSQVRGRKLWPKGLLRRMGPIGIYIPFTGEGTVDGSLHPAQLPSTMSHEMSHGYGFADEGTCNFYAWRACTGSANPLIRYSGWMSYWRYVAQAYARIRPEAFKAQRDSLPMGIRSDLREMRRIQQQYTGWGAELGTKFNDVYLKAQGVKEGTDNYDLMVLLVLAWEQKHSTSNLD